MHWRSGIAKLGQGLEQERPLRLRINLVIKMIDAQSNQILQVEEMLSTTNDNSLALASSLDPNLEGDYSHIDGTGQTVVVIDTGIDLDHPYFGPDNDGDGVSDRIIFSKTWKSGNQDGGNDQHGHGTHVSGIIASSDETYGGVSKGANIISLDAFDISNSGAMYLEEALEWCVLNAEKYSIDAVNMSLGGPFSFFQVDNSYWQPRVADELAALNDLGVVCVAAAGNNFELIEKNPYTDEYGAWIITGSGESDYFYTTDNGQQGVSGISSVPDVISVGATELSNGTITSFSQRDDELLNVFAPGGNITSAAIGGGNVTYSGTSMASPYFAGTVLLMQQVAEEELGRKLNTTEIIQIIEDHSTIINDGDDENYSSVSSTNLDFNFVNIKSYLNAVSEMKNPLFHYVDLSSERTSADFGISNNLQQSFTNKSEQIVVLENDVETFAAGGNDFVQGSDGKDKIYGWDGDDELYGNKGDDIFIAGKGTDLINGGEGIDEAHYNGERGDFTITRKIDGIELEDNGLGRRRDIIARSARAPSSPQGRRATTSSARGTCRTRPARAARFRRGARAAPSRPT